MMGTRSKPLSRMIHLMVSARLGPRWRRGARMLGQKSKQHVIYQPFGVDGYGRRPAAHPKSTPDALLLIVNQWKCNPVAIANLFHNLPVLPSMKRHDQGAAV